MTTDNPKEFWNATLGKPYVDEDNIGVTDDELSGCINTDVFVGGKSNQYVYGCRSAFW